MTASDARPPEHKCCVHTAHCYAGSRCAECYPDARPPSDVCNCHTYGHARLCPVHTQADYDAAELTNAVPVRGPEQDTTQEEHHA